MIASGMTTEQSIAALEFLPYVDDGSMCGPPTKAEWDNVGADFLPAARVAWDIMFRTKADLVDMFVREPELMMRTTEAIGDLKRWMEPFSTNLVAAEARLIVAASVAATKEGWDA